MMNMARKNRGPERLVSKKISGALEGSPINNAILNNEEVKTSIGHWKAKLVESGLLGEPKDGDDMRAFYASQSKKADDFLKLLVKDIRQYGSAQPLLGNGDLNLDFEFNVNSMAGHFDSVMTSMFASELRTSALKQFSLGDFAAKVRDARKDKTFREVRRVLTEIVPKKVMDMKVYGNEILAQELLDSLLPALFFDVNVRTQDEYFTGEEERGNELLDTDVPDEHLAKIDQALKDLIGSNYEYEKSARERSAKILDLIFPGREERARVLGTIGIKE